MKDIRAGEGSNLWTLYGARYWTASEGASNLHSTDTNQCKQVLVHA